MYPTVPDNKRYLLLSMKLYLIILLISIYILYVYETKILDNLLINWRSG